MGELWAHPGGFEADAFTDGCWFVKLWRQQPDSDAALALTAELAARGIPVPAAQRTLAGSYTAEHLGRALRLVPVRRGPPGNGERHRGDRAGHARSSRHTDIALPRAEIREWCIEALRDRRDHPWLADRRGEILAGVDRLEALIERARAIDVPHVLCHHDLFPHNVLIDRDGRVASLLDRDHAMLAPREHDLFAALCETGTVRFLQAYGAERLDLTHLEYARLARSLRDLAVRICDEVDLEGVKTWGFDGLRRVDADLAFARPFCAW
ncbi:phosphotransferase family protein [Kribbella sp. VKM Ac-2571]|uniref:phosphotransferase family protein n=1 Tax=Kribbella sp. VKM Ac-2571 TaxID=2512222 RepID=UPI001414DBC9|nr:aminoglycoside phosphotransferase family protein [Kribbella sp. VKM Ac-2571]